MSAEADNQGWRPDRRVNLVGLAGQLITVVSLVATMAWMWSEQNTRIEALERADIAFALDIQAIEVRDTDRNDAVHALDIRLARTEEKLETQTRLLQEIRDILRNGYGG